MILPSPPLETHFHITSRGPPCSPGSDTPHLFMHPCLCKHQSSLRWSFLAPPPSCEMVILQSLLLWAFSAPVLPGQAVRCLLCSQAMEDEHVFLFVNVIHAQNLQTLIELQGLGQNTCPLHSNSSSPEATTYNVFQHYFYISLLINKEHAYAATFFFISDPIK